MTSWNDLGVERGPDRVATQEEPSAEVRRLAEEHDLGGYVRSVDGPWMPLYPLARIIGLRSAAPRPRAHCYQRGVVLDTRAGLAAHAWRDVRPYESMVSRVGPGGDSGPPVHYLQLRAADGRQLFEVLREDAAKVAALVAADELPRARSLLDSGSPLSFGRVVLTPEGIVVDGTLIAWSAIRGVSLDRYRALEIRHATGRRTRRIRVPGRDVPHQRILLTLAWSSMPE